ncbi:MAG: zinc-binding dehydrogenase [Chloroflexi bacterium]|nr:zinc-binding dehydrogenase [Chloroflexota bacterium]
MRKLLTLTAAAALAAAFGFAAGPASAQTQKNCQNTGSGDGCIIIKGAELQSDHALFSFTDGDTAIYCGVFLDKFVEPWTLHVAASAPSSGGNVKITFNDGDSIEFAVAGGSSFSTVQGLGGVPGVTGGVAGTPPGVDDVVIDAGTIAGQVRELFPDGVDGVLELVGSVAAVADSIEAIRDGGRICHVGLLANEWGKAMPEMPRGITYEFGDSDTLNAEGWTPIWEKIVAGVETGHYRPNIFKVFAFEDVVEAHRMMEESRAAGKLVVVT